MLTKESEGKLREFISEICRERDYQLLDIIAKGGGSSFVNVTVDRKGGITLDECGELNGMVRQWMEGSGIDDAGISVDVSSPGLDRKLMSEGDYLWARGKKVKVRTYGPIRDRKEFTGILRSAENGSVELDLPGEDPLVIDKKDISKARLVPDI
ncbi:MAG: hypothetical protein GF392_00555 [Candidatus Omnitrophica bacterium]|nr:hypothetical protein [Candidatus Omnitrophota bacterium]